MAQPTVFRQTPAATVTSAIGVSTDASSEVWQRLSAAAGGLYVIYEAVPFAVQQAIMQTPDGALDAAIKAQLRGYATRVSA
jgi:hypothetical protein